MPQERLLTIPQVSLSLVSTTGEDSSADPPLFTGSLSLDSIDLPPSLPPRPSKSDSLSSSSSSIYHDAIPGSFQISRSPSPSPSLSSPSTPRSSRYLRLSLQLQDEDEAIFSMPVEPDSFKLDSKTSCSHYLLPNLTGSDPTTLYSSSSSSNTTTTRNINQSQNGWIKLELPLTISTQEREQLESILQSGGSNSSTLPSFEYLERNQLYVVDESNGRILGQLDAGGVGGGGGEGGEGQNSRISLEEDSNLSNGTMHDDEDVKDKIQASEVNTFNLDGKEAVVINSITSSSSSSSNSSNKPTFNASRFSVKPLSSYYTPAPNPEASTIISVGNFISHGLVIGSSLISQGLEKSAGHYVSTRPATQTPLVFKETTKKNWEQGSRYTGKAVQYSGQATQYVGKFATQVGDRIGKATGIQSKPGKGAPTGLKGLVAKSLIAINTVGDHLDASGKTLLESGSKSASQVVHHKWGSEARGIVDDAGTSVKHCALVYIDARGVTRRALFKAVGKGALKARMADGSQLYLTDSSDTSEYELKQIEQAATSTAAASSSSSSSVSKISTNPFDDDVGRAGGGVGGGGNGAAGNSASLPPAYSSTSIGGGAVGGYRSYEQQGRDRKNQ
ncbi:hypothetical protein JCM5350_001926 [Sporobolomyces pararoseus]